MANPTEDVLDELKEINKTQLENKQANLQNKMVELKDKIVDKQLKELIGEEGGNARGGENIATLLFKDKSVEEIEEIVNGLTPEKIAKLRALAKATDTSAFSAILNQQPNSGNDMLLQYLLKKADEKPQQGITLNDVVAIVKLINENKPVPQAPSAPPQNPLTTTLETIKVVGAMNEPFYKAMSQKDKEIMDLKLKEIEAKMPQDPIETVKYVKDMTNALGLGNAKGEIDLKLEEMRQSERLDDRRLDWEQKKYELEQESENQKWEQITKILEGPIGRAIQNVGSAGADRVRGGRQKTPSVVQTQCPNCQKVIYVDADATSAICGSCGAQLQRQAEAPQPPPAPTATHVDEPITPQEPTQEEETNESVEAEEQAEDGK